MVLTFLLSLLIAVSTAGASTVACMAASPDEAPVMLSLNHADGIYQCGDTIKVFATVGDSVSLVHSEVAGEKPSNIVYHYEDTCIGWVVEPQKFEQALPCPKDFDRWWGKQLKKLRREKMDVKLTEVPVSDTAYVCWSVEINCLDQKPVRGYVAMPRNAKPGSLPILEFVHAGGVAGSWVRCFPEQTLFWAKRGNGCICIDVNPFGMENGREQAYYDELENGPLKDYSDRGYESREDYVFYGMYLRNVRALDYACSLPQWDGKRVLVYGQSQGGAQAFSLAGLDKRVSAVVAIVPSSCNSAGSVAEGGEDSAPHNYQNFSSPELGQFVMSYFDGCNFLARTRAKLFIELGLMDPTCRPSAIFAGLNAHVKAVKGCAASGKKSSRKNCTTCSCKNCKTNSDKACAECLIDENIEKINGIIYKDDEAGITVLPSPWRYHDEPDPRYWDAWKTSIYDARMQFIEEYLK